LQSLVENQPGGVEVDLQADRIAKSSIFVGNQRLSSMRIPHTQLSRAALRAVVEEFVTRDGTDDTSVSQRVEAVLRHLEAGRVEVHFDDETKSCNIVPV
jgi:uncharacterized protein YheU (UPF0270 family)